MDWFSLSFMLFLIMDPMGNLSSYLTLVKELPPKERRNVVIREMLIVLAVMLFFSFVGEYIFSILEISQKTVYIGSGLILFLAALKILFPTVDSPRANLPKGKPLLVPLAIPLVAGPALLTTIMLFSSLEPSVLTMVSAILAAWSASTVILFFASQIERGLGANGLMASERLMGMVLILIAIQRFLEGINQFIQSCHL